MKFSESYLTNLRTTLLNQINKLEILVGTTWNAGEITKTLVGDTINIKATFSQFNTSEIDISEIRITDSSGSVIASHTQAIKKLSGNGLFINVNLPIKEIN